MQAGQNFYAEWRIASGIAAQMREDLETPPERLLQFIWLHQRLQRDRLTATDGTHIRILHPGFWNHEAGPDFRGAVIQFGAEPARTCDVEVDLHPSGWRTHRHDVNPAYREVGLHVVWEGDARSPLPTLPLKGLLDAPLGELHFWYGSQTVPGPLPPILAGRCRAALAECEDPTILNLLRQAGRLRLMAKAAQLHARARAAGWEQALWEGLLRALGYKHNAWPMQRLGELRPALAPAGKHLPVPHLQARLFGVGGLLPAELTRTERQSDQFIRQLWDIWWREQHEFADHVFPKSVWRFNGLRPANHPQRRIGLAGHWLATDTLPSRLEDWCRLKGPIKDLVTALSNAMGISQDPFWSSHWTLRSKPMASPQPLLGLQRITDLAINVILPWLWIRAREGRNDPLRIELERRYDQWPAAEDNTVLRLARERLFGGDRKKLAVSASAQQGLLQIVRDFCDHSNSVCNPCSFPELVGQFRVECRGEV